MAPDRYEFLRPWMWPLSGQLHPGDHHHLMHRVPDSKHFNLVLRLSGRDRQQEYFRAVRDALVLLTLLAYVDINNWVNVLRMLCGLRTDLRAMLGWLAHGTFEKLRFNIVFDTEDEMANLRSLEWLLLEPVIGSGNPRDLVNTVQRVLSQAPEYSRSIKYTRMNVFVSVACTNQYSWWSKLKALSTRNGGWEFPICLPQHGGFSPKCSIILEPRLKVGIARDLHDYPRAVENFATDSGGITIENFAFKVKHVGENNGNGGGENQAISAYNLGRVFERVFCASGCAQERLPFLNVIDAISTRQTKLVPAEFARLCSAIANCQRTSRFKVRMDDIECNNDMNEDSTSRTRSWTWQCMAYALFSPYARVHSTITSVDIVWNRMTQEDIAAVAAILNSTDATQLVYDRESRFISNRDQSLGMLKQGAKLTLKLLNGECEEFREQAASWELGTDVYGVQVLHDEPGNSEIIAVVPGYGLCSVARGELIPTLMVSETYNPVTALDIHLPWGSEHRCLPEFLQLVGPPLTSLSIEAFAVSLPISAILQFCPNLKSLSLKYARINTKAFLQAYETGGLRLEDLDCCFDDEFMLMDELKDKTRPLGKTLKGLACYTHLWEDVKHSLAYARRMLELNTVLEFFHLIVSQHEYLSEIETDFVAEFHKVPLAVAHSPLPLECRIAFISVFTPSSQPNPAKRAKPNPGCQLLQASQDCPTKGPRLLTTPSPDVMFRIFEFAAQNVFRRVYASKNYRYM